jgi:nitrite reductase/ring-hydroxylating ferredoxin subunit
LAIWCVPIHYPAVILQRSARGIFYIMAKWIDVTTTSDLPEGGKQCAQADDMAVVVFHFEGSYYAIENTCPHAGLPLGEGEHHGKVITCPFHGYAYRVDTGRNIDFPEDELPVRTLPVRVEGQNIQVDIEK